MSTVFPQGIDTFSTKADRGLIYHNYLNDLQDSVVALETYARAGRVLNLKSAEFGAVGDGSTDDTVAVQAWLTALAVAGGTGFAPRGNYKITSAIALAGSSFSQNIVGEGNSSAWTGFSTDQSLTKFSWYGGATPMLTIANANPINLSGFTLDCRSIATYGIAVNSGNLYGLIGCDWHNLSIYTPQSYGVGLRAGSNPVAHNRFSSIHIDGGKGGIVLDSFDKAQYNVDVHHNTFQEIMIRTDGTNPGLDLKSADNNWFYGVNVDQSSGSAGKAVYLQAVSATQLGAIANYFFGLDGNSSETITCDQASPNFFIGLNYTNGLSATIGGTNAAYVSVSNPSNGQAVISGIDTDLLIRATNTSGYARLRLRGKTAGGVEKTWRFIGPSTDFDASDGLQIFSDTLNDAVMKFDHLGAYYIKDGITAPATLLGSASIYIDVADGDLKIKFGDGTVKTITVDT